MAYYLDIFSPQTYQGWTSTDRTVTGFRERYRSTASRIQPGDKFICYITGISRWCGVLAVTGTSFDDDAPRHGMDSDPYTVRVPVQVEVFLEPEKAVPVRTPEFWNRLSFTREHDPKTSLWTGVFRSSLNTLSDEDGALLEEALKRQASTGLEVPLSDDERRKFLTVKTIEGDRSVSVPESPANSDETSLTQPVVRASIRIQGLVADIGRQMGFRVWLPRNDRGAILRELPSVQSAIVETLPLNYDDTTLKTIEQIDVLWLRGRAVVRAFEIEHTTAIYSGILRMADLLALQPNLKIATHIVAPIDRRDSVLEQIKRPVFALMDRGPLADTCTYISYESVQELAAQPHLQHLSDRVLEDYAEEAT